MADIIRGYGKVLLVSIVLFTVGCKKGCDDVPEPAVHVQAICTNMTSNDPASPPVVMVGDTIVTMGVWLDTDGLPGFAGQDNIYFYTSKEDVEPGPDTTYDLRIHMNHWYEDSIGFVSSSIGGCYDWLDSGDTISPNDHLVAFSTLYQNLDTDPDCAMFGQPRYVGFVRIIGGAKYGGYLRLVPHTDAVSGSVGFEIDQVRLADCAWDLFIID